MSATRALELSSGLQRLKLELAEEQQTSLLDYCDILLRWNGHYNLIGQSTEQNIIQRHILDSLSILSVIAPAEEPEPPRQARWIDVGSGAGLPGIPLAIARPDIAVTLLDSNSKKTRFLLQASAELSLANVEVVHSRVEQHTPAEHYDGVLSRAWTAIPDGLKLAAHLGGPGSRWWFMKGQAPEQELLGVPKQFTLTRQVPLPTDGEARHLLEFTA